MEIENVKSKKVIVFGATGHLGSRTAIYLKNKGFKVLAIGHRNSDNNFFEDNNIDYIGGFSLENSNDFNNLPSDIDAVVNLAGTMPAHADSSPMPYVQSIIVGTVNICEWMKKINCKKIVFNTTPSDVSQLFGTDEPVDDDAFRSFPKDGGDHAVYAIAKNAAVDMLEHYMIAYDFKPIIFRHLTIYGWVENPYYNKNGVTKIIPWRQIMQNCIDGKNIEIWGNPNYKKELLYINDFTNAIYQALISDATGMFNLAGDRPYTLEEQIQGLIDVFSKDKKIIKKIYCPEKPSTPQNLLKRGKAQQYLNWVPQYSWVKACEDMKNEMKTKPYHKLEKI